MQLPHTSLQMICFMQLWVWEPERARQRMGRGGKAFLVCKSGIRIPSLEGYYKDGDKGPASVSGILLASSKYYEMRREVEGVKV